MNPDVLAFLLVGGLMALVVLCLGIGTFGGWIGRQIEARQNRPLLEAKAATKRAEAERALEDARIRRLELELGLTTSEAIENPDARP